MLEKKQLTFAKILLAVDSLPRGRRQAHYYHPALLNISNFLSRNFTLAWTGNEGCWLTKLSQDFTSPPFHRARCDWQGSWQSVLCCHFALLPSWRLSGNGGDPLPSTLWKIQLGFLLYKVLDNTNFTVVGLEWVDAFSDGSIFTTALLGCLGSAVAFQKREISKRARVHFSVCGLRNLLL